MTVSGNDIGNTATYTCDTGYELKGDDEATCTEADDGNSASFKPDAPVCESKSDVHKLSHNTYIPLT